MEMLLRRPKRLLRRAQSGGAFKGTKTVSAGGPAATVSSDQPAATIGHQHITDINDAHQVKRGLALNIMPFREGCSRPSIKLSLACILGNTRSSWDKNQTHTRPSRLGLALAQEFQESPALSSPQQNVPLNLQISQRLPKRPCNLQRPASSGVALASSNAAVWVKTKATSDSVLRLCRISLNVVCP